MNQIVNALSKHIYSMCKHTWYSLWKNIIDSRFFPIIYMRNWGWKVPSLHIVSMDFQLLIRTQSLFSIEFVCRVMRCQHWAVNPITIMNGDVMTEKAGNLIQFKCLDTYDRWQLLFFVTFCLWCLSHQSRWHGKASISYLCILLEYFSFRNSNLNFFRCHCLTRLE